MSVTSLDNQHILDGRQVFDNQQVFDDRRDAVELALRQELARQLSDVRLAFADLQAKHRKLKEERDAIIDHTRLPCHWKDMVEGDVLDHLKEQRRRLREEFGGQEPCFGARPVLADRTPYGGYYDPSAPCYRPKNDDDDKEECGDRHHFLPIDPPPTHSCVTDVYCPTPTKYRRLDGHKEDDHKEDDGDQHSHSV